MNDVIIILATGLGLAGLYFLLSSGLSLIFGLMGVLNLAHGVFFAVGAFAAYLVMTHATVVENLTVRLALAFIVAAAVGFVGGAVMEKLLVARNYGDHVAQILVTIGVSLALVAVLGAAFGQERLTVPRPAWLNDVINVGDARIPTIALLSFAVALACLAAVWTFLQRTRHGLIIRAGSENRSMVRALGIDVGRSFTLVFALGGTLAAIGGVVAAYFFNGVTPGLGTNQLIFAFIVVVIGGLGSFVGTAVSSVLVALVQQFLNFYAGPGLGDLAVVALLALVLLVRPQGLMGEKA